MRTRQEMKRHDEGYERAKRRRALKEAVDASFDWLEKPRQARSWKRHRRTRWK